MLYLIYHKNKKEELNMKDLQKFLDESLKEVRFIDDIELEPTQEYDMGREIAELVSFLRMEQEMTQRELAEKSGVSQANISRIENNNYCPSIQILKRLADAMGKRLVVDFMDKEEF